jgi:PAS domain S-box-containing protein
MRTRRNGLLTRLVISYFLLGACIALLSLVASRYVQTQVAIHNERRSDVMRRSQELAILAGTASEEGYSYVLSGDPEEKTSTLSRLDALSLRARELADDPSLTSDERQIAVATAKAGDEQRSAAVRMFAHCQKNTALDPGDYKAYDNAIDEVADSVAALASLTIKESARDNAAANKRLNAWMLNIGGISLLIAFVVGLVLARSITAPILALRDAATAFGEGQVDIALVAGADDEIGELRSAFVKMAAAIRGHIETIARKKERLATIFESIDEVLVVCDADGTIAAANAACCRLLACDESNVVGHRAVDFFTTGTTHGSKGHLAASSPLLTVGKREADLQPPSGNPIPIRLSVSTLQGRDGAGYVLVAQDLTATRHFEAELRQAQKLEAVGRLASGIAHEINTPVQFASDSVYFVKEAVAALDGVITKLLVVNRSVLEGTQSPDAAAGALEAADEMNLDYTLANLPKAIDRATEGLHRVTTIVRSMKEFAHPDSTEMSSIDLNRAIASTITIATNELKYVADVVEDFGELPNIVCHAGELNQAILNIIVNAAHAIGDTVAGTDRRGLITVRTAREEEQVLISISDTGGGIPPAILERIFDPFFTTKEVGRGTGQGLAIARSVIVDKHHGTLKVDSEVGKGTTFLIRFPMSGGVPLQTLEAA